MFIIFQNIKIKLVWKWNAFKYWSVLETSGGMSADARHTAWQQQEREILLCVHDDALSGCMPLCEFLGWSYLTTFKRYILSYLSDSNKRKKTVTSFQRYTLFPVLRNEDQMIQGADQWRQEGLSWETEQLDSQNATRRIPKTSPAI